MSEPQWRGRVEFVEFAEAIGVRTDSIMAAMPEDDNAWRVMFTRDEDTDNFSDDTPILMVGLTRTSEGILATTTLPHKITTAGEFRKTMRKLMEDK